MSRQLQQLLERIGTQAVRTVVTLHSGAGDVIHELPSESSSATHYAGSCAALLQHHGLIDAELLRILHLRHPEEIGTILQIAQDNALPADRILPQSTSSASNESAKLLVQRKLPKILEQTQLNPRVVLSLAGIDTCRLSGHRHLDQWADLCTQYAATLPTSSIYILDIINEVQELSFSSTLSRWAAAFCRAVRAELSEPQDPGPSISIRELIRNFAENEEFRWRRIKDEAMASSVVLADYPELWRAAWHNIVMAWDLRSTRSVAKSDLNKKHLNNLNTSEEVDDDCTPIGPDRRHAAGDGPTSI